MSKGRDSALHSGVSELGIFGNTSMLGANLPVAAGLALTFKMEKTDNVVVAYFGEGASNVGDFHEALNFAGVQQLPIIFVCENNQYAYSVPVEKSMAIDDVADRAEGYGFDGVAINGNDVLAVYQATQGALARARSGDGPTLIECKTYRWHGHSEHDKAFYRTDEELAMWKSRDPIPTFTTYLQARNVLDRRQAQGDRGARQVDDRRRGRVRDERARSETRRGGDRSVCLKSCRTSRRSARRWPRRCGAIRRCSCWARTSARYGGAFGVTQGLHEEFGEARVIDTPISESAIVGISIGAALRGYRPVAEMQFADFISCGFDQIVNQAATLRYPVRRPRGGADRRPGAERRERRRRPVSLAESRSVVRASARPEGGGAVDGVRREGSAEGGHSRRQSRDLLRAQVSVSAGQGPGARRRRDRADRRRRHATRGRRRHAVTYGAMVTPSLEAADRAGEGRRRGRGHRPADAAPLDKDAILRSVEKTNRALIVHEDVKTLGIGAEISAVIMEERFESLDAPVMRLTYPDTHPPFSHVLERANLPNADKITDALRRLAAY